MEQREGKLLAQKLQEAKRITSGILFKTCETNRLGADVFAACKESVNKKEEETIKKIKAEEKEYLQLKEKADEIISSSTNIEKLSNEKLKLILKSLKRNGDPALPTKKKDMLELYKEWKLRKPRKFVYPVLEVGADMICDNNKNSDNEEINISAV